MPSDAIPKAVVFDLDGLMFNTEELYIEVGSEVLRRRGCELSSDLLDKMMGRRPRQAIETMIQFHGLTDTVDEIESESREIFAPILDTKLSPMPGLLSLLDALEAAEVPKAVATSSPRAFAANVMSRFELLPRFEFVLTAEDVHRGKPDPEIYLSAADRLDVAPCEVLVLEDSQTGCRSAVAAGAIVVAVPAAHSRHHEFEGASLVISDLADPQLYARLGVARA